MTVPRTVGTDDDGRREQVRRLLKGAAAEQTDAWARLDAVPFQWVLTNARLLHDAGLTAEAAADLWRRLDPDTAADLGRLVDAGRMASLDTRWLHWWAASGLLRATEVNPAGHRVARRRLSYNRWVTEARRYLAATGGDQEMAALAAAAQVSVDETRDRHQRGALDKQALAVLVALRENLGPDTRATP